ncbi:MAG: hypothetical protein Q9227_002124 [Pyrenula ochraceoflavens]
MASSRRRPRDSGGGGGQRRLFSYGLLPFCLTVALQQLAVNGQNSPLIIDSRKDDIPVSGIPLRHSPPEVAPQIETQNSQFNQPERFADDESSLATLAPAGENQAVRAPVRAQLVDRREPAGLSSLLPARSLQDVEVEDFVLMATLDGVIYANDRITGTERWALGVPDSPMIETTHHRRKNTECEEGGCESESGSEEEDYTFVVEPSKDGDIYIAHKDPRIGLQRLGITVKSLAERTPQQFEDPPLVYTAKQESSLYTIDAVSGNVLKQFSTSPDAYINKEQTCRRLGGLEIVEDEACEPRGTLSLGRVQYTVFIRSGNTGETLCTIKYSEWVPNNRDVDLQTQYTSTLDKSHIFSFHDGRVVRIDYSKDAHGQKKFTKIFPSPVARVFDVVRSSQSSTSNANLTVLAQPQYPPYYVENQLKIHEHQDRASRVYYNFTDTDSPFVMSERQYPGITSSAPKAKTRDNIASIGSAPLDQQIAGWHQLPSQNNQGYENLLTISGPAPVKEVDFASPHNVVLSGMNSHTREHDASFFSRSLFLTCFLGMFAFLAFARTLPKRYRKVLAQAVQAILAPEHSKTSEERGGLAVPVTPTDNEPQPDVSEILVDATDPHIPQSVTPKPMISRPTTPVPPSTLESRLEEFELVQRPQDEIGQEQELLVPEGVDSVLNSPDRTKAKKNKRGCRGGKGKNRKKDTQNQVPDAVNFATEVIDQDGQTLRVGEVTMDLRPDSILGEGSQAIVYAGKYQSRPVAVKRMNYSRNSIAEKEIHHLMLSDDHENVIRYHAKVASQMFVYIVLDQCDTTIDHFIDFKRNPNNKPWANQEFDPHDATRQLIAGLEHLHSLKLVHRDLKPQNVLVKFTKVLHPNAKPAKPRYLISDFGLCKKIEDVPGSMFNHTNINTNNAAGTSGWKAPELLLDARARIAAPTVGTAHSDSADSIDGTAVDPISGRRVNKLIDVFSAGCIIHYMHTAGKHPFDGQGGYSDERDLNIRKNNFNIDKFYFTDYTYELEDLILQMVKFDPEERIDTFAIRKHPYFWAANKKTNFLCEMSDYCEALKKEADEISKQASKNQSADPTLPRSRSRSSQPNLSHPFLLQLESLAGDVIGLDHNGRLQNWLSALPQDLLESMRRQRGYDGTKMLHLLRAFRNKKNHFDELPDTVKDRINVMSEGFYEFWTKNKFPSLLVNVHALLMEQGLVSDARFEKYFTELN